MDPNGCDKLVDRAFEWYFSVYTLPPNQEVSVASQRKINRDRKQIPPFRDAKSLILKKSKSSLRSGTPPLLNHRAHKICTASAHDIQPIGNSSASLVVTSPSFLDVVDYKVDNWLRCWFNNIDPDAVLIWAYRRPEDWCAAMESAFRQLERVLIPGGWVVFEVGEVSQGKIALDTSVVKCGLKAGLNSQMVVINDQNFTKTSHCWGVKNRSKGTNTNRIVVFRKNLPRGFCPVLLKSDRL